MSRVAVCAGYAYLWLLAAVAMLGLGAVVAAEVAATLDQRAKERELLAIGRQFRAAIRRYHETQPPSGLRQYPQSLDELVLDARIAKPTRHLRKVFVDPMTGSTDWGLVRVDGRIVAVHSLSDRVPIRQAGFEPDDAAFTAKSRIRDWVFGPQAVRPPALPVSSASSAVSIAPNR